MTQDVYQFIIKPLPYLLLLTLVGLSLRDFHREFSEYYKSSRHNTDQYVPVILTYLLLVAYGLLFHCEFNHHREGSLMYRLLFHLATLLGAILPHLLNRWFGRRRYATKPVSPSPHVQRFYRKLSLAIVLFFFIELELAYIVHNLAHDLA